MDDALIERATEQCPWHDMTQIWELMDDGAFDEFCSDVRENGQREPIRRWEGKVVDGRNRQLACLEVGREPEFDDETYEGWKEDDVLEAVFSLNHQRRHSSPAQRALAAQRYVAFRNGEVTMEQAAKAHDVGQRSVERVAAIAKKAPPEIIEAVEKGVVSITDAESVADMPQEEQLRRLKMVEQKVGKASEVETLAGQRIEKPATEGDAKIWMKEQAKPYRIAVKQLDAMKAEFEEIQKDEQACQFFPVNKVLIMISQLREFIKNSEPYVYDGGPGENPDGPGKGAGFLTRQVWDQMSDDQRMAFKDSLKSEDEDDDEKDG